MVARTDLATNEEQRTMGIAVEKVLELVEQSGLEVEEKAGWYKVSAGGRSVYFPRAKTVSRCDLSGFNINHPAVKQITDEEAYDNKLGRIRGKVDFSQPEDAVLEALQTAFATVAYLGQGKRGRPAGDVVSAMKGALLDVPRHGRGTVTLSQAKPDAPAPVPPKRRGGRTTSRPQA